MLISGHGSNLNALANAIQREKLPIEIAAVISDRSDANGLTIAQSLGIPTHVIASRAKGKIGSDFDQVLIETLSRAGPDLIVLAGFMRILGPRVVRQFKNRVINIHPSLLPAFRGLNAHQQALDAGVRFSGCTVHYVVEDVDAGPIIAQAVVPVLPGDTADTLAIRVHKQEHILFPAVIKGFAAGQISLAYEMGRDVVKLKPPLRFPFETSALMSIVTDQPAKVT